MIEVLLAMALIAVVVLSVLGIGIGTINGTRKSLDTSAGQLVAETELQRAIYQADNNSGDSLWAQNSATVPLRTYTSQVGSTAYQVALYAEDVVDTSGNPIGGASVNHAKKVDVLVSWWVASQTSRSGYGLLQVQNSRLLDGP